MQSKTRIIVLHMKEIIYTVIFLLLGILLIVLLASMFLPGKNDKSSSAKKIYTPGVYTSALTLNNTTLEVEVTVDESHINSIRFANLDETVTTMFPLLQPAMESIADQIIDTQSLKGLSYRRIHLITSQVLVKPSKDPGEGNPLKSNHPR